ncbi:hypothetical protein [Maribacter sp. ACAM166]|uniref:hypothetical protein n=1 Tax=Maribacter sp. ACAM166 TaxID=2508996 RepID=UPI0010FE707D|nr:hypothetical protein [Maribacter sp. ACAM166]TLP81386.1 hypothetical protein ES765_05095 [Maribacter sp. ACAM166]
MENFKGTEGKLSLAEDHRIQSNTNQFVIMAKGRIVASISRQNHSEGLLKYAAKGILKTDPEALANANLFIAAKDMFEALHSLLDVIDENYESGDEVITSIQKAQIKKAKHALLKATGYAQ